MNGSTKSTLHQLESLSQFGANLTGATLKAPAISATGKVNAAAVTSLVGEHKDNRQ